MPQPPATMMLLLLCLAASGPVPGAAQRSRTPYFVHQCHKVDPLVNQCIKEAANHLIANFRRGIPELGYTDVEPIIIDEISIALGSGPDGYRASFRDIEAYGVSNLTIVAVRSDLDTYQYQLSFYIPKITARAHYRSSGVLIMVQASGGGDYWGEYEGVKGKVYFRARPQQYKGRVYLVTEQLKMDFAVKNIRMGIENIHNGNTVIQAALNLMINANSQELLKEMKPDLQKKLVTILKRFLDNLFTEIPYDMWMME